MVFNKRLSGALVFGTLVLGMAAASITQPVLPAAARTPTMTPVPTPRRVATPKPVPTARPRPTQTPVPQTAIPTASPTLEPTEVPVVATPIPPADLPSFTYNDAHPVLAYYYGWWEPEKLDWGVEQPIARPTEGVVQIGDDYGLVATHIREAIGAGLDGFVVNRPDDLDTLLALVHGSSFRVTIQVDPAMDTDAVLDRFYNDINDPNILRYQGKPVVFFWRTGSDSPDVWAARRQRLDPDHNVLWVADGDDFSLLRQPAFDGISPYAIAWSPDPAGTLALWKSRATAAAPGKLFVPPVSPGCNDTPARPVTCLTDRANGSYYQSSWNGALAAAPSWAVMVNTWNEWLEDTQIEPAVQYGDLYLQLTKQFVGQFQNGPSSAPTAGASPN